jgi:hypothetical protein
MLETDGTSAFTNMAVLSTLPFAVPAAYAVAVIAIDAVTSFARWAIFHYEFFSN